MAQTAKGAAMAARFKNQQAMATDYRNAKAALAQAGYTSEQINEMQKGSAAAVKARAQEYTNWKPGMVVTSMGPQNPMLIYAGLTLGAVAVFYLMGRKKKKSA
jgi:methionine synthase I (cobalamin-dependent)